MLATDVLGFAMKNFAIPTEVPASLPLRKVGPDALCWTAGMKTLKLPVESVYRKGCSSVTGLVGTTVFCWQVPAKTGPGAPVTPEKTLFQSPFGHPSAPPI